RVEGHAEEPERRARAQARRLPRRLARPRSGYAVRPRDRRHVAPGACALLLAAALGGCGTHESGVTIRFWAMGREGEVVQELVHDFERENPGVHVEVQQIPWTAAHEKLLTAHVGGSTPDLGQLGNTWIPEFTALHALHPLDRFLDSTR